MINKVIEEIRSLLYDTTRTKELTSDQTLKLSQELNRYINFYSRVQENYSNKDYSRSFVHLNAILNILEVSKKEGFDLQTILEKYPFEQKKWIHIELVKELLHFIENKYGSEAIEHIGQNVPKTCLFPESISSFTESIQGLNRIYYQNHKSIVYIGEYLPYTITNKEIQLFCHTPHYSSSFNYGIIKGLAQKFNHPFCVKVNNKDYGGQFKIIL